jgi:pimeloyl-ACP methyl ester carboxylesterase
MAARQFAYMPVSLLLRHPFESQAKIARVPCPILLGHGGRDAFIPCAMCDRLAASVHAPVTQVPVPGARHADYFSAGGEPLRRAFHDFLERL